MNKGYVVAVAIIVLVAVIAAVALFMNKPSPAAPISSTTVNYIMNATSSTSTAVVTTATKTTATTSTTTTTPPATLRPKTYYFLNVTNGSYYYVGVLNASNLNLSGGLKFITVITQKGYGVVSGQYDYNGLVLVVFYTQTELNETMAITFYLNNGEGIGYIMTYMGKWPYGSVIP